MLSPLEVNDHKINSLPITRILDVQTPFQNKKELNLFVKHQQNLFAKHQQGNHHSRYLSVPKTHFVSFLYLCKPTWNLQINLEKVSYAPFIYFLLLEWIPEICRMVSLWCQQYKQWEYWDDLIRVLLWDTPFLTKYLACILTGLIEFYFCFAINNDVLNKIALNGSIL